MAAANSAQAPPRRRSRRASAEASIDLYEQPGHLIRRAHQISVSMFHELLGSDLTPVQYAVLRMLKESPGLDQVTLARRVALDTSSTAEIAARLEAKGWIVRELMARRQRSLSLTAEGAALVERHGTSIRELNRRMLAHFDADERREFARLLAKFVQLNNEQSRAPLRLDEPPQDVERGRGRKGKHLIQAA